MEKENIVRKADGMNSGQLSDRELMQRVLENDCGAFESLVNRYKVKLFNVIYRMIGIKEEAEDILQETFLRVFRERQSYDFQYQFSTWIYTIALNLTKNELKKRNRFKFLGIEFLPKEKSYMEQEFNDKESLNYFLEKAISTMPDKYKKVFLLRDINQLSYEEISESLSIPLGTVKSRVNRARLMLRKKLKPKMEGVYELSKGSTIPVKLL
jgi:RNA polymerase sigma-70 factor (ECF subfamily)